MARTLRPRRTCFPGVGRRRPWVPLRPALRGQRGGVRAHFSPRNDDHYHRGLPRPTGRSGWCVPVPRWSGSCRAIQYAPRTVSRGQHPTMTPHHPAGQKQASLYRPWNPGPSGRLISTPHYCCGRPYGHGRTLVRRPRAWWVIHLDQLMVWCRRPDGCRGRSRRRGSRPVGTKRCPDSPSGPSRSAVRRRRRRRNLLGRSAKNLPNEPDALLDPMTREPRTHRSRCVHRTPNAGSRPDRSRPHPERARRPQRPSGQQPTPLSVSTSIPTSGAVLDGLVVPYPRLRLPTNERFRLLRRCASAQPWQRSPLIRCRRRSAGGSLLCCGLTYQWNHEAPGRPSSVPQRSRRRSPSHCSACTRRQKEPATPGTSPGADTKDGHPEEGSSPLRRNRGVGVPRVSRPPARSAVGAGAIGLAGVDGFNGVRPRTWWCGASACNGCPAVSYSPTLSRVQYHRRCGS